MRGDETRAAYYAREARESARIAHDCAQRGNARAARHWLDIAESERDAAAFWASESAPSMPYLKPAFML